MVKGAGREVAGFLLLLVIFLYEVLMPLCLIVTPSVSDADSLLFDDVGGVYRECPIRTCFCPFSLGNLPHKPPIFVIQVEETFLVDLVCLSC